MDWAHGEVASGVAKGRIWGGVGMGEHLGMGREDEAPHTPQVLGSMVEVFEKECHVGIPDRLDAC